jgi:hypothetical protein
MKFSLNEWEMSSYPSWSLIEIRFSIMCWRIKIRKVLNLFTFNQTLTQISINQYFQRSFVVISKSSFNLLIESNIYPVAPILWTKYWKSYYFTHFLTIINTAFCNIKKISKIVGFSIFCSQNRNKRININKNTRI